MTDVKTETKTVDAAAAIAAAEAAAKSAAAVEAAAKAKAEADAKAKDDDAPDLAAQLAAANARIAELTGGKDKPDDKPDDKDVDPLVAMQARIDAQAAAFATADGERLAAARADAFDRLGIADDYRDVIPAGFDPRTAKGRSDLESWIAKRPALARSRAPKPPTIDARGFDSAAADILSGKRTSTLVSPESISRMLSSN